MVEAGAAAPGAKRRLEDGAEPEHKRPAHTSSETVYRLLVHARKVGAILGKGGSIVKAIREETGGRIRVVEGIPGCDERVVVVSAREDPAAPLNGAQRALKMVHAKVLDSDDNFGPGGPPPGSGGTGHTRMLVCHTQAGSIIGKGGAIIKEIREMSGAQIKILPPEELPPCALANDRVVQTNSSRARLHQNPLYTVGAHPKLPEQPRVTGVNDALTRAMMEVSKQIRLNPPRERPGGPPPSCHLLSTMAPAPSPAPAPAPVPWGPPAQAPAPGPQPWQQQPQQQPVAASGPPSYPRYR